MTAVAKRIKPDVIHCHDCLTLPTGWKIKKALGIPLIYDAHEIYEAAASRVSGSSGSAIVSIRRGWI